MSGRRPGVGRRRQIVGVGFAGDLEDRDREAFRHAGARREPLGVCPGLDDGLRGGVARLAGVGKRLHLVEEVEHQQRILQPLRSRRAAFRTGEKIDQRLDVEAAEHGAEKLRRADLGDKGRRLFALRNLRQKLRLDLCGVVHARRDAVRDEVEEECFLALGRISQKADEFGGLLLRQRQRQNPECGAFSDMGAISFEHGVPQSFLSLSQ